MVSASEILHGIRACSSDAARSPQESLRAKVDKINEDTSQWKSRLEEISLKLDSRQGHQHTRLSKYWVDFIRNDYRPRAGWSRRMMSPRKITEHIDAPRLFVPVCVCFARRHGPLGVFFVIECCRERRIPTRRKGYGVYQGVHGSRILDSETCKLPRLESHESCVCWTQ